MIEQKIEVYDKSNIYEFDNNNMLHYYPKRIMELIESKKYKSCLELGIGHGYTVESFSSFFDRHVVLDGDGEIIKNFKNKFPNIKSEIIETYFEDWDTDEKFDIIVLGFVLEHVDNPNRILNKYKKYLNPEGRIFITVPNAEALNRRIGLKAGLMTDIHQLSENDFKSGHKRYYTLTSFRKEIVNAGLTIIREEGIFLKPITTAQMIQLNFSDAIIKGFFEVGKEYPELCLALMVETLCVG